MRTTDPLIVGSRRRTFVVTIELDHDEPTPEVIMRARNALADALRWMPGVSAVTVVGSRSDET